MTALVVVLMFAGFVVLDIVVRAAGRRLAQRRELRRREAALQTSLRLDFTQEAPSLKRVEVDHPKARILAVDDEPVVLDSFRRILVLAGYNVDTVENGPEALGLVQRRDYDFVFTDLKMPGMDGVEVVKGVKHLRPDTDVAVITGYATIETAVETMQHGAVDYVQKPFTPDELTAFADRLQLRRQARLDAQRRPTVRLVAPALAETASEKEFCVPGGLFLSGGHAWVRIEPAGQARTGIDDFARKALGSIDAVELPQRGAAVRRGEPLYTLRRGAQVVHVLAPVGGRVAQVNEALRSEPERLTRSPYDRGWVCLLQPTDLAGDLRGLRIGRPVVAWYQEEIERLRKEGGPAQGGAPVVDWSILEAHFLAPVAPARV
jgi:CheY-like chemotaxis protein